MPPPGSPSWPTRLIGGDVDAVRDGVGALHGAPGVELRGAVLRLLRRVPADRRRVEENGGAQQRGQPRRLRVPLIPADQACRPRRSGSDGAEAEVARREVELLVVERVVRDVHLAVGAASRAVGVEHDGGVVVDAGRAPLEDRADDHDLELAGQLGERLGGGPGDRLGQVEVARGPRSGRNRACGTAPAGRRSGRPGPRPPGCRPARPPGWRRIGRAAHLHQPDLERLGLIAREYTGRRAGPSAARNRLNRSSA